MFHMHLFVQDILLSKTKLLSIFLVLNLQENLAAPLEPV